MHIPDSPAYLQELLVLLDSFFVLSKVVEQDTRAVVGSAFISRLASPFAGKSKNFVVFKAFLSSNAVVRISVTHGET